MKSKNIIAQLEVVFKGRAITNCISFEKSKLFYIDDNKLAGKCLILNNLTFSKEDEQKYLKIINENENKIALWAIDGCFISSGQSQKRCDCIFFDKYDFCFAEFKLNATSLNPKTVKKNREDALSQLKSTIQLVKNGIKEKGHTFLGYNLEAYLCTPINYPNKNDPNAAVEFLEDYGVKLYEQNFKKCK